MFCAVNLSVIESRKLQDGHIETDPIVSFENTEAYGSLIDQLFDSDEERKAYKTEEGGKRLTIPENFFVVGTVNMDETTFSFSRKVLDRAMTIEMNEVDLKGGLEAVRVRKVEGQRQPADLRERNEVLYHLHSAGLPRRDGLYRRAAPHHRPELLARTEGRSNRDGGGDNVRRILQPVVLV